MAKKVTKKVTKKAVKKNVHHRQAHFETSGYNRIVTLSERDG